jgi:translocation and assembly module TamB
MERTKRRRYPLWMRIALSLMFAMLALVAAAVAVRFWITSDGGRAFILSQIDGRRVGPFGTLRLSGLQGDPLNAATLADIALVDDEGVWLRARDARVEWTPTALFGGNLEIRAIDIRTVDVLRQPILAMLDEDETPPADIGLRLDSFSVGDLHLAEPVIGIEARYGIAGGAARPRDGSGFARMTLSPVQGPADAANLSAEWSAEGGLKASAALTGPSDGLVAALLQSPTDKDVAFTGSIAGTLVSFNGSGVLDFGGEEAAKFNISREGASGKLVANVNAANWPLLETVVQRAGDNVALTATADLTSLERAPTIVRVTAPAGDVEISGNYDFATWTAPTEVATRVTQLDLARVADPLAGLADAAGMLSWNLAGVTWQGEADARDFKWPSGEAAQVSAPVHVSYSRGEIAFETTGARIDGGRIDALPALRPARYTASARGGMNTRTGVVEIHGSRIEGAPGMASARGSYSTKTGAMDLQGSARVARLGDVSPLTGSAQGPWRVRSASSSAPIRINADIEGRGVASSVETLNELIGPTPRVNLVGAVSNGRFAIESGSVQMAGLRANMTGRIADSGAVTGRATGRLNRAIDVGGAVIEAAAFVADVTGTISRPVVDLRLSDGAVTAAGISVRDVSGRADATFGEAIAGRFALNGDSDTGPFRASGRIEAGEGDWRINNLIANLGELEFTAPRLAFSEGELAMNFTASGPLNGIAGLDRGALIANGSMRLGDELALDVNGRLTDLRSSALRLSLVSFNAKALDGKATLEAHATGSLGAPIDLTLTANGAQQGDTWSGGATLAGTVDDLPIATSRPAVWRRGPDDWSLDAAFAALRGEIDLDLAQSQSAATGRMELRDVNLRGLSRLARITPIEGVVTGLATFNNGDGPAIGDLKLSVANANPVGVTANPVSLEITGSLRGNSVTAGAKGSGQGFSLDGSARLAAEEGEGFAISIDPDAAMSAELDLEGRAEQLWALFGPDDQSLRGALDLDVRATGTLADPALSGGFTVAEGAYEHGETGLALRDIRATGVFDDTSARISDVSARDGAGGTLTAEGSVDWAGGLQGGVTFKADDLRVLGRDDRFAVVSGGGAVKMGEANILVSGQLAVQQARISIEQPASAKIPTIPGLRRVNFPNQIDDEPSAGPSPFQRPVELDLRVTAPRRIVVFGRGLDTEWGANVHITGPIADPSIAGTARLERGALDLAGRRFAFDTGTITLDGPIRVARIDIAANRSTADITARVRITGTPVEPKFVLESTPALPQDEVLARILFGRSVTELSAFEGAQLAAGLAQLAGGQAGFDPVGLVRQATGLDRVAFGAEGGIATVSAGKYIAEDVYVQVGAGGTGGVGAEVEWEPTDEVSIISSADGAGDTKIAVRWKKDY